MVSSQDAGNYYTHYLLDSGGAENESLGRNYSFYWSRSDRLSLWVAYPLNSSLIGSAEKNEVWGYDPKVPNQQQAVLYNAYSEYNNGAGYDKGHQIPSADRRLSKAVNKTTYYFTNVTPQSHDFNGQAWASLEDMVRDWALNSAEFYVVTGCVVSTNLGKAHDNNGNEVIIPGYYYKALLRKVGANWSACAFWFNHANYPTKSQFDADPGNWRISVDILEEYTGIDFFPNLIGVIGQTQADQIERTATAF